MNKMSIGLGGHHQLRANALVRSTPHDLIRTHLRQTTRDVVHGAGRLLVQRIAHHCSGFKVVVLQRAVTTHRFSKAC